MKGKVKVLIRNLNPHNAELFECVAVLKEGQSFGEMALVSN